MGGKTFKELKAEADKKPKKNDSEDSFEMFEPDFGAAEIEETTLKDKEEKKEEAPVDEAA